MNEITQNIKSKALARINAVRFKFDYLPLAELPRGEVNSPRYCPIATSIQGYNQKDAILAQRGFIECYNPEDRDKIADAWGTKVDSKRGYITYYLVYYPPEIDEFVEKFDLGEFPELRIVVD